VAVAAVGSWATRSVVQQVHSRPAGRDMDARARLGWVRLYEQLGDAGVAV
jgi:hypothetical protein